MRWALGSGFLSAIIYVRDTLLIISIISAIAEGALLRNLPLMGAVLSLLVIGGSVGFSCYTQFEVWFGMRMLLPICAGILLGCSRFEMPRTTWQASLLSAVLLAGVIANTAVPQLPWTGASSDIMGLQVEASREWSHLGVESWINRPAGFSRSSFNVASQLFTLGVFVIVRNPKLMGMLVWIAVGVGIALTTTKGVLFAWLTANCIFLTPWIDKKGWWARPAATYMIVGMIVGLPGVVSLDAIDNMASQQGTASMALTESLIERASQMWPAAFVVAQTGPLGILLGRGIGGVGGASLLFQKDYWNPGDNFFVYLILQFGLITIPIMAVILYAMLRLEKLDYPSPIDNLTLWIFGISILSYGIFSNLIEEPFLALGIGAMIGRGLSGRETDDARVIRSGRFSNDNFLPDHR